MVDTCFPFYLFFAIDSNIPHESTSSFPYARYYQWPLRGGLYRHLQGDMNFPRVSTSSCPERQMRHIRSSPSASLSPLSGRNSSSVTSSTYGEQGITFGGVSDIIQVISMDWRHTQERMMIVNPLTVGSAGSKEFGNF